MQFFLVHIDIITYGYFLVVFLLYLIHQQFTNTNKDLVYIKHLYFTKHGLSTVEAKIWDFPKHAQVKPKKKGLLLKKNVYELIKTMCISL